MSSRLSQAIDTALVTVPEGGRIVVFGGGADDLLRALPADRTDVVQPFFPDHNEIEKTGYGAVTAPGDDYALAVVRLPRARDQGRAWIAAARSVCAGAIVVDGSKTDGIESALRELRKRADTSPALSKAHGKLFVVQGGVFEDWVARPADVEGFATLPGVFSAGSVDRGSRLLAEALPADLKGRVADLGAGWGYLSRGILERDGVKSLDLIEADHVALECARRNISDPRARFFWDDATTFQAEASYDVVVMNPPFHAGRKGDPSIGQSFLRAAARLMARHGSLWLVANRHLPYERMLEELFAVVEEQGSDAAFKLTRAARPRGQRRS